MESAVEDNECEILFMELIQQFSTIYPEAHVVVEEIHVLNNLSDHTIFSIVIIVTFFSQALALEARTAEHHGQRNVIKYPSEKIW